MTPTLHPTADAYDKALRRYKASQRRLIEDRAALEEARQARDDAIREDPDDNAAAVARRFGVSATWVKKVCGRTT